MSNNEPNNTLLTQGSFVKTYGINGDSNDSNHMPTTQDVLKSPGCFGSRHVFALLGFLGLAIDYMLRVNLSVTIVEMVLPASSKGQGTENSNFTNTDHCPYDPESEDTKNGEFDWDEQVQGLILGSFFWGYMTSQIPGGILAEKYGGKLVFGLGTLFAALFSLLGPVSARYSKELFIAVRVLTGLAQGVALPSMHVMLSRWVPPSERSTIGAFVSAGMQFGTVIAFPLTGALCHIPLDNGWPLAFYVPGMFGILWFIAWYLLISDSPDVHPGITEEEKRFIMASMDGCHHKKSLSDIPWNSIITSMAFWAILVAHTGQSWGFYMLLTKLPTYMKSVLHYDLKSNTLYSALPYLAMWIFSNVASVVADALQKSYVLNTTQTRKIFNTIGFCLPACAMMGVAYAGCDRYLTVALITFASGANGAVYSGFQVNHMDIAPNFAGILMGLTNCVANSSGFLAPFVVGLIVENQGSLKQWQLVFYITAAIYAGTSLFYGIFATGETQWWNRFHHEKADIEMLHPNDAQADSTQLASRSIQDAN